MRHSVYVYDDDGDLKGVMGQRLKRPNFENDFAYSAIEIDLKNSR